MSELSRQRMRALVLFIAPVVLLVGFIYHPYVDDETDAATVASEVIDDPDRYAIASLIIVVGIALTARFGSGDLFVYRNRVFAAKRVVGIARF